MESDIASTGQLYSFLGWLDKNRKQIISSVVILVIVGIVVSFVVWRNEQKRIQAGETLSSVFAASANGQVSEEALLKVANDYSGTAAAARALLIAGGQLFSDGNVSGAQSHFEKFIAEYPDNSLLSQAKLGYAKCIDAQGKTNEATTAFKEVVDRFPGDAAAVSARFYLAGLYEGQGKMEMARDLYLDLARDNRSTYGSESIARLTEMFQNNPSLRPGAATASPPTAVAPAPSATPAPVTN